MDPRAVERDAVVLLTGLIRALTSYADAETDRDNAETIMMDVGQIRRIRDGLADRSGLTLDHFKIDYGGNREWSNAFLRLVNRPELPWPSRPSIDPWERAAQA